MALAGLAAAAPALAERFVGGDDDAALWAGSMPCPLPIRSAARWTTTWPASATAA